MLRNSLHQSAQNALQFAMSRFKSSVPTPEIINLARDYVYAKNPDAIAQLKISDDAITDIIHSKVSVGDSLKQ
ncbi:hypothetical protein [Candidatus Liberibacter sp.]|uniref:hypothetical protein n=1 Tax=Candidatus Liberibacter sp. TaxID=34022 RepID=UPI0015F4923E|nr:hypothetical protein [Candidatus Liberibacter sp.]MBA5724620.1 hypothetical protein [Candidatus Liberibacter sp.]